MALVRPINLRGSPAWALAVGLGLEGRAGKSGAV